MPISSWSEAGAFLKNQLPDLLLKRRFNFITIHYFYMIGMTILISVVVFAIGGMRYIDALFFASGACTQSGLNTIDINLIHTGQQFMLYLAAMLCNPIIIHGFVVFVRLYWFEKRFKDVVKEARTLRRTKSSQRSRNNTIQREDLEQARPAKSVRGMAIRILRNTGHATDSSFDNEKNLTDINDNSASSSGPSNRDSDDSNEPKRTGRRLTEQDAQRPRASSEDRLPTQRTPDQHIRFLETQRHPEDSTTLRIPSPRELDRGAKFQDISTASDDDLVRRTTTNNTETRPERASELDARLRSPPLGNHLTFDEPQIVRDRDKTSTFPRPGIKHANTNPPEAREQEEPQPLNRLKSRRSTFSTFRRSNTVQSQTEATPYLSYQPTIGRNSFFVNLTEEQREELGGIEYRALKTLAVILVTYFLAFHTIGVVCLVPWIYRTSYGQAVTSQGQGRAWWGIFTSASAFNDLGFTLTATSMIPFQDAVFPLLLMTFLIVIGNTGFPCALRFVIWVLSKLVPVGSAIWEELQFLLDHPRRCFTLLFPRAATWWLFAILVVLNGLDLIFFIILDLNDPVVNVLSPGVRVLDGLFQASSTRTAGFSVVNLAELHPAIQVSYLIMMYISAFPIAISMRRTNVYEEKSLGIYASKEETEADDKEPSYVGAHIRKQLSFDLWYVFLGLFVIAIVEGNRLQTTNQYAFTLFSVLFEIVSAYGTVGMSLGYPTINASFSAEFATLSKLVIIAMQIRGRHRGLPYELDRAILLPSESLQQKEQKEAERMWSRRRSSAISRTFSQNAVDGEIQGTNFRPETGLRGGGENHDGAEGSTTSSNTGKAEKATSFGQHMARLHKRHTRLGLGNAMFKLASAPDHVKDEMMKH
jgi:Trk-type K+ transport system membrane component